ncbi:MAG: class I SAM-dependent methyltransferase [Anaerolineales bacterium]
MFLQNEAADAGHSIIVTIYDEQDTMQISSLTHNYSNLEAWFHDTFIAERTLHIHTYILQESGLEALLEEPRRRRLLDVGCGGGQPLLQLRQKFPQLQFDGIDYSAFLIGRAAGRAHQQGFDLDFQVADAQALPFPPASFDVVYSLGSIKHWPDPVRGIGECWRVLKPGGELLLADAISDVSLEDVENFYTVVGFPKPLKKLLAPILYQRLFRPTRPLAVYHQVAAQLDLPAGTVSRVPSLPTFVFHTQKP